MIQFNLPHFDQEPKWFGQQILELSEAEIFDQRRTTRRHPRHGGSVAPPGSLRCSGCTTIINVPMGDAFGLPLGISFYASAFSEPKLITLASGFEAATKARRVPQFLPSLPRDVPARRGSSKSKGLRSRTVPAVSRL